MEFQRIRRRIIEQQQELQANASLQLIDREVYALYSQHVSSSMVKVIVGPRRCGKSTLARQLLSSASIAYANFDDEILGLLRAEQLNQVLEALYGVVKNPSTLLFDEIQNIRGWELFVNRLARQGLNIIVTGSNAKLLSQELATHLTGRHIKLELLPFSFREYLTFVGFSKPLEWTTPEIGTVRGHLEDFLHKGGFPEAIREKQPNSYLRSLYDSVVTHDIAQRYRVRYTKTLKQIAHYLVSNFGCRMTHNKLKNIFDLKSVHTVKNYTEHVENAYLIVVIERFSQKLKQRSTAARKVYGIDTGLVQAIADPSTIGRGKLYENIVAIELLRAKSSNPNLEIGYWLSAKGSEVDFIVSHGRRPLCAIQVAFRLRDPSTRKREIKSLLRASEELGCNRLILITDEEETHEHIGDTVIEIIPLWKWLVEGPMTLGNDIGTGT